MQINDQDLPSVELFALNPTGGLFRYDQRQLRAYWFTGLEHRALISPNYFASRQELLTRPPFYIKTNLAYGALLYIDSYPKKNDDTPGFEYHRTLAFSDDLEWEMNSYLFALAVQLNKNENGHSFLPRYVINQVNNIPYHGPSLHDHSTVVASPFIQNQLNSLHLKHISEVRKVIKKYAPSHIDIVNNAQTSLGEEMTTYEEFIRETLEVYISALAADTPNEINGSQLVGGLEVVKCSQLFNQNLLSFYMTALRSHTMNTWGSNLALFKNLYNILEYYMEEESLTGLQKVINKKVGKGNLAKMLKQIKMNFNVSTYPGRAVRVDEDFFGIKILPRALPSSDTIIEDIADRLYTKRNAVMHSKKTFKGSIAPSIRPSRQESMLDFEIILLRAMTEHIIMNAKLTD